MRSVRILTIVCLLGFSGYAGADECSPVGVLGGAALGGFVGNQFGSGAGKALATLGGVLAGGAVGCAATERSDHDRRDRRDRYDRRDRELDRDRYHGDEVIIHRAPERRVVVVRPPVQREVWQQVSQADVDNTVYNLSQYDSDSGRNNYLVADIIPYLLDYHYYMTLTQLDALFNRANGIYVSDGGRLQALRLLADNQLIKFVNPRLVEPFIQGAFFDNRGFEAREARQILLNIR